MWDDEIRRRDEQVLAGGGGAHDAEDVLAEAERIIRAKPVRLVEKRATSFSPRVPSTGWASRERCALLSSSSLGSPRRGPCIPSGEVFANT